MTLNIYLLFLKLKVIHSCFNYVCSQYFWVFLDEDRVSDFDLKLMEIYQEHLSVADSTFNARITLPSKQFQRICLDLSQFSESSNNDFIEFRT